MIFNVDANLKNKTNYINLNHKWTLLYDCHSNLFVSRQVIKRNQKRNESYYYQGNSNSDKIAKPRRSFDHPKLKILFLVTDRTILEIVIAMKSFYSSVYVHCADIFTVGIDLTIFFSSRFL